MIKTGRMNESMPAMGKRQKAIYLFGRGEGSPQYDEMIQQEGESYRAFQRRAEAKFYKDMRDKEKPEDSRKVYMKYVEV